jgi:hypothetical protein
LVNSIVTPTPVGRRIAANIAKLPELLGVAPSVRRDAMAMAAAPYLHAKLTPATSETSAERPTILVEFVVPTAAHSPDQE